MKKIHNFSAGPCILPPKVLQGAADAVINFAGTGLSLIEVSHRSKEFVEVMKEARQLVRELMEVPDNYSVLFLQGGASLGFLIAAANISKGGKTGYINTGTWSTKAIKEAGFYSEPLELASSKDKTFSYIPSGFDIPSDLDYLHFTSNNTIFGTQFANFPNVNSNLICDMSSDIFSRKIKVSDFALIYAGAQKNMGPAGTVLYIVNNDVLAKMKTKIPTYLDLETHITKDSMFNTPPVFAVYTSMLMLRWIKENGGVSGMNKLAKDRSELLYQEIDSNPEFVGHARQDSRSMMNVTFRLNDETRQEEFDKMWQAAGISGLKGHRSVGGYRASMYNALPLESVKVLVQVMKDFSNK